MNLALVGEGASLHVQSADRCGRHGGRPMGLQKAGQPRHQTIPCWHPSIQGPLLILCTYIDACVSCNLSRKHGRLYEPYTVHPRKDSRLQPLMDLMVQIWGSPDELHDPAHDAIADAPLADLVPVPAIADTPLPDLVPAPSIEDASAPEEVAAEGPPGPVVDAYEVFFATPSDDENCPEADDDGNPDVFPEVAQVDQSVQETDVSDCPEQQEPVADEPVQAEASDFLEQPEPMDVGASGATDQQDLVVPGLVEHSVLEKTDHACWPPCESTSKRRRQDGEIETKLARLQAIRCPVYIVACV